MKSTTKALYILLSQQTPQKTLQDWDDFVQLPRNTPVPASPRWLQIVEQYSSHEH